MLDDPDALVDDLQSITSGDLRVVATYDREGYEPHYVREDAEANLEANADRVHRDLVLQGVGREHLEDLFDAGGLRCSMHGFEDLTAFHFVGEGYTGLFVSVDADADLPLATFVERCKAAL